MREVLYLFFKHLLVMHSPNSGNGAHRGDGEGHFGFRGHCDKVAEREGRCLNAEREESGTVCAWGPWPLLLQATLANLE